MVPTDPQLAWFAGLFEGEGTFETSKASTVRMTIGMTDEDVIERVQALFPGRPIGVRPDMKPVQSNYNKPRPVYVWRVSEGREVRRIIELILPWLGKRRRKRALEVLAHLDSRHVPGTPLKPECKSGHMMSGDNLVRRGGQSPYWRCRQCAEDSQRRYQIKKRERVSGQVISA